MFTTSAAESTNLLGKIKSRTSKTLLYLFLPISASYQAPINAPKTNNTSIKYNKITKTIYLTRNKYGNATLASSNLLSTLTTATIATTTTNQQTSSVKTTSFPSRNNINVIQTSNYFSYEDDPSQSASSSSSSNSIYSTYKPEIGLRTGLLLGSMLLLIILYLLWRNRCRCLFKGANSNDSDDYDMDYWLAHVDKQKLAQKTRHLSLYYTPQLPDIVTDRQQATAAWVSL